ncbi:MAG TPA: VIT domain-containing protein [Thermoanaerobaculia bacterium]
MSRTVAFLVVLILAIVGLAAGFAIDTASSGDSRPVAAVESRPAAAVRFTPASFRFPKTSADQEETEPAVPIRLTASDGTGLSLVALEANGILEPPFAFTELRLTFENPRNEVIEGRFRIALPPGAALSRFAMKIGDSWQEGEVVERQRARQAYEDFLHRRQDPALLEQEAGNEFSARVFPIPARSRKELIVSYSHALARSDEPYVLPLLGLSEVGRLDVRVLLGDRPAAGAEASNLGGQVSDRRVVELHKRAWTPDRDFEIGQDRIASRAGLRHGNLAVARVAAPVEAVPQEISGLYVLVDSSASRALGYATQVRRLAELVAGLRGGAGGATPLGVAVFDQEIVPVFEGTAAGFGQEEVRRLGARRPLGASDLDRALAWLGDRLSQEGRKYPRVLLITDGVATAGETETRALKAAVHALGAHGVERLDVLAVGGLRDEAALRELTTGNLAHDGQRIDGDASLSEIARRLTLACRSGIAVTVEGAEWVWPQTLDGVQPGDETLVFADLPAGRPLRLALDGRPVPLGGELASAERPLLERAWVQARIERLLHLRETDFASDDDLRRALGHEVTELSVQHRVLSPFTALLVLETEADYARFGLDRRALADILTVGLGGLEVLARSRPARSPADAVAAVPKRRARPDLEALGYVGSPEAVPGEPVDAEAEGIEGGVEGGISGGVIGGVVGGTPGGVVSAVPAPPPPPRAMPQLQQPVEVPDAAEPEADDAPLRIGSPREQVEETIAPESRRAEEKERQVAPYTGRFAEVMRHLAAGQIAPARALAEAWIAEAPGDVLALLALGEVWEAAGETAAAARAYGSLIDLYPSRVDLRRLAGERLERLGDAGLELAIDTYRKAVLDRPDHPTGHRLLAWALLLAGRFEEAFEALEKGLEQDYPGGRFAGADRVLKEDLGLLAAAWLRAEPARREEVLGRLETQGSQIESEPSLRFILTWETDANDVDLHVYDRQGGHAYYSEAALPSGGNLYADVTTGYGPECFVVREPAEKAAAPYRLRAHYYNRGPMGYGMGILQIVGHDGEGRLSVEPRPFVVMADGAMVDLGAVGERKTARKLGR